MIAILLVLCVTMIFSGCQQAPSEPAEEPVEEPIVEEPDVEPEKDPLKVACLMSGPINDQGWNATAYEGLLIIEEEFGAEISYSESTTQSDFETVFRNYAEAGFDIIFGHGFEFNDAATMVNEEYPDSMFVIVSGYSQADNLIPLNVDNYEQGFIQGVVAGLVTETNQLAYVGGMEIPPIQDSLYGYVAGSKYVNPDAEVHSAFIGNFEDTSKVKELALVMIDNGADVLIADAAQAGLGAIEAAKDRDILMIGSNSDQNAMAPDKVVTSGIDNLAFCMKLMVDEIVAGTVETKSYVFGIKEGAVYLAPYHGFEDKLSDDVKATIEDVISDIMSGKLDTHSLAE